MLLVGEKRKRQKREKKINERKIEMTKNVIFTHNAAFISSLIVVDIMKRRRTEADNARKGQFFSLEYSIEIKGRKYFSIR